MSRVSPTAKAVLAAFLFALACELASPAPWHSVMMVLLSVCSVAMLALLTHALLRVWALVLWVPFLLLVGVSAYIKHFYNLELDPFLVSQIIGASPQDFAQFATFGNACAGVLILLLIAVVMLLLFRVFRKMPRKRQLGISAAGLALCIGAGYALPEPCLSNSVDEGLGSIGIAYRIPHAYNLAAARNTALLQKVQALPSPADKPSEISTLKGGEGVVCILHIGESVRADRLSLNGYARDTTPWLRQHAAQPVNFTDCTAISTLTTNSMLTILTDAAGNMERDISPQLDARCGSVMDLFAAHGFSCHGFFTSRGMDRNETWGSTFERLQQLITAKAKGVYEYGNPAANDYRPKLQLPIIHKVLEEESSGNRFLLINNVGSHSPFFAYDQEHPAFTPSSPDALHNAPHTNPQAAEMVSNAYDNTIRYTDEYIRDLLEPLRGKPYLYIYVSDHGEPVGENNEWTRGNPNFHRTQWCRVPLIVIASPEFVQLHPHFAEALAQLRAHAATPCAHENIFHTLLGVFGISTPYYNAEHDLSSPQCKPYSGPHPSRNGEPADGLKWE